MTRVGAGDPTSAALVRAVQPSPGQQFNQGELVVMAAIFSDPLSKSAPVDVNGFRIVTAVSPECLVKLPDGTEQTLTPVLSGSAFQALLSVSAAGVYRWRIYSPSGLDQGVVESFFQVRIQRA